jgi:hypothetical protein
MNLADIPRAVRQIVRALPRAVMELDKIDGSWVVTSWPTDGVILRVQVSYDTSEGPCRLLFEIRVRGEGDLVVADHGRRRWNARRRGPRTREMTRSISNGSSSMTRRRVGKCRESRRRCRRAWGVACRAARSGPSHPRGIRRRPVERETMDQIEQAVGDQPQQRTELLNLAQPHLRTLRESTGSKIRRAR